jgi:hypothetical protein
MIFMILMIKFTIWKIDKIIIWYWKLEKRINFKKLKMNYNSLINEYLSTKKKKIELKLINNQRKINESNYHKKKTINFPNHT